MPHRSRVAALALPLLLVLAACAPAPPPQAAGSASGQSSASNPVAAAPKRVVAVVRGPLPTLYNKTTVGAPDAQTVTVTWKKPYVEADHLFSAQPGAQQWGLPLPRHILESSFDENKAGFLELPYWGAEFVGSGPFKLQQMLADDRLNLAAFDGYVLGRPKIDEMVVRFIPDS